MKTSVIIFLAIFTLGIKVNAQVTDIDHNQYEVTKIGNQEWTTSNLNTLHFRNGDEIFLAKTKEEWTLASRKQIPACAYYDFDAKNGSKHGLLYNWYAVSDSRGLAPEGFHIPSEEEFLTLVEHEGGHVMAGNSLKSTTNWKSNWPLSLWGLRNDIHSNGEPYRVGNGTNSSNFNAFPSGSIGRSDGKPRNMGLFASFWTSTKCERTELDDKYNQPDKAVLFDLKYHEGGCGEGAAHWGHYFLGDGMSIRCVKN